MRNLFLTLLSLFVAAPLWAVVNINTASEAELQTLNGIGEAKAKGIVEYRQKNGPFKSVDDLKSVSGIGPKIVEKIRKEVTVAPAPKPKTAAPATLKK